MLDADEELVDGATVRDLLHDESMEGDCLREVNFIGEERGIEASSTRRSGIFRNRPAYRYSGALHEQIMGTVDPEGGAATRFRRDRDPPLRLSGAHHPGRRRRPTATWRS